MASNLFSQFIGFPPCKHRSKCCADSGCFFALVGVAMALPTAMLFAINCIFDTLFYFISSVCSLALLNFIMLDTVDLQQEERFNRQYLQAI